MTGPVETRPAQPARPDRRRRSGVRSRRSPRRAGRRSGLRNPEKAVRGLGAGTLALEALVLLLAIQPIRVVGGDLSGAAIAVIVALAVACRGARRR